MFNDNLENEEKLEKLFPYLKEYGYFITSPATDDYNCIAYAAGVVDAHWEPDPQYNYHWPHEVPREYNLEACKQTKKAWWPNHADPDDREIVDIREIKDEDLTDMFKPNQERVDIIIKERLHEKGLKDAVEEEKEAAKKKEDDLKKLAELKKEYE